MAQINEYTPQVETPGPVGGVSPNVELAGAVGRSIENLGQSITQGGEQIHRRMAQEETSDVYANIANLRYQKTMELQQKIQDGSLDVDKFSQDFDNEMSDIGSNLNTPEGSNYFERQSARLKGSLLKQATAGQAQIASRVAIGAWQDSVNKDSLTIQNDPMQFSDIHDSLQEHVDSLVTNGNLPPKMKAQAVREADAQYAEAAILGHAQLHGADAAKYMMNEGGLGKYLTVQQRENVLGHVDHIDKSNVVKQEEAARAVKLAQDAHFNSFSQKYADEIYAGKPIQNQVTNALKNGQISLEQADTLTRINHRQATENYQDNPANKRDLMRRIIDQNSPDSIKSVDQLHDLAAKGSFPPEELSKYTKMFLTETDQGKKVSIGQKNILRISTSLLSKNPFDNSIDPNSQTQSSKFLFDYYDARSAARDAKMDPEDLTNPNSKNYWPTPERIQQYKRSWQDDLGGSAGDRKDKALGLKPTGSNPNPVPVEEAIRPGESLDDYDKRMTGKKSRAPESQPEPPPPSAAEPSPGPPAKNDDLSFMAHQMGLDSDTSKISDERRRKNKEYEARGFK